jgi:UDP-N-acetylmuramate--alanine ligase
MNIYFSGIGGVGIGPLAEISFDAGYQVQGSDQEETSVTRRLEARGIKVKIGQDGSYLQQCHNETPLDWFVYTSALPPDHPELLLARSLGVRTAKRDELLAQIISEKNLKLIAVAGTHGKTTTTGMLVWALLHLGIPVSYSIGTTLPYGPSGRYVPGSEYFVYECDEYDRNFLHFSPHIALITSVEHDHPDTYPTEEDYMAAFRQFISQSQKVIMWNQDSKLLGAALDNALVLSTSEVSEEINLPGAHNRRNATLALRLIEELNLASHDDSIQALNSFPGTDRRFERLAENLYTDYAHHPSEIAATLQMARELNDHVVVVYQPHQNARQHTVMQQYADCFDLAEKLYWAPTYLSRENDPSLLVFQPSDFIAHLDNKERAEPAELDNALWQNIQAARRSGKLVLCFGAGTIDEWVRSKVASLSQSESQDPHQ